MQDRPDATELIAAIRAYLVDEIAPVVPRDLRFGVRVAANACAILERELADDAGARRAEHEALHALLGRAPRGEATPSSMRALQRELADAIRAGELDDRLDEALPVLRECARRRVDIAHPGWSATSSA